MWQLFATYSIFAWAISFQALIRLAKIDRQFCSERVATPVRTTLWMLFAPIMAPIFIIWWLFARRQR